MNLAGSKMAPSISTSQMHRITDKLNRISLHFDFLQVKQSQVTTSGSDHVSKKIKNTTLPPSLPPSLHPNRPPTPPIPPIPPAAGDVTRRSVFIELASNSAESLKLNPPTFVCHFFIYFPFISTTKNEGKTNYVCIVAAFSSIGMTRGLILCK